MSENKIAKIPVASHGLHKHSYNYPWLSSINFGDVMPCYINTVRKGERDSPKAGMYSQLMPIAHNAFATGRYNFKAIFVPYKLVWRPWYYFDQQTQFNSNGSYYTPTRYPYISHSNLSSAILSDSTGYFSTGTSSDYDVVAFTRTGSNKTYYKANASGARILRILGALGCMPSFIEQDNEPINVLPILCYIKAFADYYYPNNYYGSVIYHKLMQFFDRDDSDLNFLANEIVEAIEICSRNFYEGSVFDLAWDNPVSPNESTVSPAVTIPDITNDASITAGPLRQIVSNTPDGVSSPSNPAFIPSNGTPFVGGSVTSTSANASGVLTKYVLDALTAVTLWAKRRQLGGLKLIDRFLASRGVSLSNDSARISSYLGQRNVEIQVSGVENNTDVNLGELAGRGIASSGDSPLSFECRAEDDGIFLVIVSALPDANFPVLLDGFSTRKDFLQNYNAEYDKLGAAAVPSRIIQSSLDGSVNSFIVGTDFGNVFGFLNQYWDEVQERPRLLGDFILKSRGADSLSAYHTFRMLNSSLGRFHSYDFQRMSDASQYQRLFYSDKQENLMLFLRWYGEQYKEKLPLGDSYDWDDDELNRKVSVVTGGSQK